METIRYELQGVFAEFDFITFDTVQYSYGSVGFEPDESRTVTPAWAESRIGMLRRDGWAKADEKPISELADMGGDELLDWIGGITR